MRPNASRNESKIGNYGNEGAEEGILKDIIHVYEDCSEFPHEYYATHLRPQH